MMIATQTKLSQSSNGATVEMPPLVLKLHPVIDLTDDEFFELCQVNRDLRLEKTAEGEIIVMPPAGGETGSRNSAITAALYVWSRRDGVGIAFDSSTGFKLPNGATRSPDAAWVQRTRLAPLTAKEKERFLPLCPDFVIELRSRTDPLTTLQAKMVEYIANGAQLGWLIDPVERQVHIYQPGIAPIILDQPATITGDPLLPGFVLELSLIWDPGF